MRLLIKAHEFHTEQGYDKLQFFDYHRVKSDREILELDGYLPVDVTAISTGPEAAVRFMSDSAIEKSGFLAKVEVSSK